MKYALKSGAKTVTTAGTRAALSTTPIWARSLRLSAPAGNTGVVYIGDVTVAAANGISIAAGSIVSFSDLFGADNTTVNLANIYVDAATSGDKVTFAYLEEVS